MVNIKVALRLTSNLLFMLCTSKENEATHPASTLSSSTHGLAVPFPCSMLVLIRVVSDGGAKCERAGHKQRPQVFLHKKFNLSSLQKSSLSVTDPVFSLH